jgi:hypothetical protein
MTLWMRDRDGLLGPELTFGTAAGARPRLATNDQVLLVSWSEDLEGRGPRVMARAFTCD